jgi:hypothetical protein
MPPPVGYRLIIPFVELNLTRMQHGGYCANESG